MKKLHLALIVLISILLMCSLIYGGLWLYSGQKQLPKGVQLSGWNVGKLKAEQVLSELEHRLAAMKQLKVEFGGLPDAGKPEIMTLAEAGVSYEADDFTKAVLQLQEGHVLKRALYRYRFQKSWTFSADWDMSLLKQRLNTEWERERFGDPVNAMRSIKGDAVTYTPGKTSLRIGWMRLQDMFTAALPGTKQFHSPDQKEIINIELPLEPIEPEVTLSSLKDEGIERKIMEFSTYLGASGPGRVHNVTSAAQAVDGIILKPGDVFNYAEVIAKAQKEYGFREAPVIISGRLVPGIGGGICQVSSTLYNAVLLTGLEVVERRNHSLPVNYVSKGRDATYAEGAINFRFRNNTGKHLLLRAQVIGKSVTIKFFGTFPKDTVYYLETKTIENIPAPQKYVRDSSLAPGQRKVLQPGKPGYIVETYRVKRVNGKVLKREIISRDVYRGQSSLIGMNPTRGEIPGSRDFPKAPVVEDGVSGP
ncbi:VanW family protein [Paenibacillus lemnae]|uniref:Vancomycin resistance protein n=1 Tax=Paenibacillus lemnae TaxID=1330551 RepID=A0A848M917_PAELE|nr:VanW family protein [Paenibacillus lemnae]NMO96670.1 vancomycin resistance protein [Paenibacillus lemnae]